MPKKSPFASCVESGTPVPRRLHSPEAVIIIVIVSTASMLVAVAGLPLSEVLQLLAGAGLLAVLIIGLSNGALGLRLALRAMLTPGSTL